jgi:hypothetical protein
MHVREAPGGGTELEWRVPLPTGAWPDGS